MREKFILAPGANGTEVMRNLALHGVNCFNLRICGATELAKTGLIRSGISVTEELIGTKEENAMIAKATEGVDYFGEVTYSDVQEIASAIRKMRNLVVAEDEASSLREILAKGQFREKNDALYSVYSTYINILKAKNGLDHISLIKKATAECDRIDADFIVLKEYPLNPAEEALCNKLSGNQAVSCTMRELYQAEERGIAIESYKNCYGAPNEVEVVLQNIYEGKSVDRSVVAVTDAPTYSQLFFDYALLYDIPVTFGCGIPIVNSNPAKLLTLYNYWLTEGFFSGEALSSMLDGAAFDKSKLYELFPEPEEHFHWSKFYELLSNVRLTNQAEVNAERIEAIKAAVEAETAIIEKESKEYKDLLAKKSCIPYLETMARELALPAEEFIAKYARIRKGSSNNAETLLMKLDMAAVTAIYEELSVVRSSGMAQTADDIIQTVLKRNVCRQSSCEGALHITDIGRALTCVRENVYVVGLSATKFPGSPKENYLLLDEDLKEFGMGAYAQTSDGRIMHKREMLHNLVRLASCLGSKIYVSYAGLNVSELKKDNASSLVFELYREEIGRDVTIQELEQRVEVIGYFEPAISATREVGKAYNQGLVIDKLPEEEKNAEPICMAADKEYSPTALSDFFACPRKFMFKHILRIPEPEEINMFEVISAKDVGTLAHSLMERLSNSDIKEDEFRNLSKEYFERFVAQKPPVIMANVSYEKAQFLELMESAYEMKPEGRVISREEKITFRHESGIILQGIPDCVEHIGNNTYRIIDYKTGRNVTHVPDDIETCLQIVIYAYLLESAGLKVAEGEFRYLRLGETVTCRYNDKMKKALAEKLAEFKCCIENAEFNCAEGEQPEACKYCQYGNICGKY